MRYPRSEAQGILDIITKTMRVPESTPSIANVVYAGKLRAGYNLCEVIRELGIVEYFVARVTITCEDIIVATNRWDINRFSISAKIL